MQSITESVRTQKWEQRRKDGRPESRVGSYVSTWFSHQICLWVWRTSRRLLSHGSGAEEAGPRTQLPPVVETPAPLSQRHVRADLNQSSAAAEVSAGILRD